VNSAAGAIGNIVFEGNEVDLRMSESRIIGAGVVTLRPANASQAIAIGSPEGVDTQNVLNLDMQELRAFQNGFNQFIVGHESSTAAGTASPSSPNWKPGSAAPSPNTSR